MTLNDLVPPVEVCRDLAEKLAAKGITMEPAFSWTHIYIDWEVKKSELYRSLEQIPAPTLEELLAFLWEHISADQFVKVESVRAGAHMYIINKWPDLSVVHDVFNADPKLAACELIERMVGE